jgi:hypothetical protein
MLCRHAMPRSHNAALQQAESRFYGVRVNVSANALTAPERLRLAHHEEHGLCQTLQNRRVPHSFAFFANEWAGR